MAEGYALALGAVIPSFLSWAPFLDHDTVLGGKTQSLRRSKKFPVLSLHPS